MTIAAPTQLSSNAGQLRGGGGSLRPLRQSGKRGAFRGEKARELINSFAHPLKGLSNLQKWQGILGISIQNDAKATQGNNKNEIRQQTTQMSRSIFNGSES